MDEAHVDGSRFLDNFREAYEVLRSKNDGRLDFVGDEVNVLIGDEADEALKGLHVENDCEAWKWLGGAVSAFPNRFPFRKREKWPETFFRLFV